MKYSRTLPALLALSIGALAQTSISMDEKHKNLKLVGDRFKPLQYDQMTPAQKTMVDHLLEGERGGTGGPFNVTLRSPEMGDIAQNLGAYLRFHSSLPRKLNEFAIIMTGRRLTSQYEFYAHRPLAIQAGLSEAIVNAVAEGRHPTSMKPDEEAVYNFCQELLNKSQVSDATFKAAVDLFGERGVVDLTAVVGYYHFVSFMLNVDRYPLPNGTQPPLKPLP
jgi:4-carboxymuconolactone decarboxylase